MARTSSAVLGLGILGLALVWWRGRGTLTGTVTTSEGFDLSPYGGPTSYPAPLMRFAEAIARAEGFYVPGSIPQRHKNPGDLKLQGDEITVFDSVDQGWAALYRQLWLILTGGSAHYTLDMTIAEMGRVWTATQQGPWSTNVADALNVPVSTPLWQVLA